MLDLLAQNSVLTLFLVVALGALVGLIPFGPIRFVPAGALFVGWLERTGPLVWSLPTGASATLRQFGLLLFLAAVGLSSGPALVGAITQPIGLRLVVLGVVLAALGPALMAVLVARLGMSPARSGGLVAGFIGNPSLLAFANGKAADERVDEGYATLFAVDQIIEVVLVQMIVALVGST